MRDARDAPAADFMSLAGIAASCSTVVTACVLLVYHGVRHNRDEPAMNALHDAAYNMATLSATVALYHMLIKNDVLARQEAVQILLDEAVAKAIQAEAQSQEPGAKMDVNRQCAEILKFIAEKL